MNCHICIKVDVKESYYQTQDTITLRLKPPAELLELLETSVQSSSISLKLEGSRCCLFVVCLIGCLVVYFIGEDVWRAELYSSIFVDFSARLSGKWIEIVLRKEKPSQWPSLRVSFSFIWCCCCCCCCLHVVAF